MPTKLESLLESTGAPVSALVSPGLSPDSLLPHAAVLVADDAPVTAHAFSSARLGMRALYTSMHDMETADLTIRKTQPSGLVVDGHHVRPAISSDDSARLAASLGQRFNSTAKVFDQHLNEVVEAKAKLETDIARALENPKKNEASMAQAASDIRAYVKSLPDGRRMDFLHGAISAGDHEVLAAVLGTTGFVSGLDREQFAIVRDMAAQKFAARPYEQHAALVATHATMVRAAQNWTARFGELLPTVKPSATETALNALKGAA